MIQRILPRAQAWIAQAAMPSVRSEIVQDLLLVQEVVSAMEIPGKKEGRGKHPRKTTSPHVLQPAAGVEQEHAIVRADHALV